MDKLKTLMRVTTYAKENAELMIDTLEGIAEYGDTLKYEPTDDEIAEYRKAANIMESLIAKVHHGH